jgi:hypothetical protein
MYGFKDALVKGMYIYIRMHGRMPAHACMGVYAKVYMAAYMSYVSMLVSLHICAYAGRYVYMRICMYACMQDCLNEAGVRQTVTYPLHQRVAHKLNRLYGRLYMYVCMHVLI